MIKQMILAGMLGFWLVQFAPPNAFAQEDVCDLPGSGSSAFCQDQRNPDSRGTSTDNRVFDILNQLIDVFVIIGTVIAMIVIIISAIQFVTSSGDASRISRARSSLIFAIVGIVVMIAARALILYVLSLL